MENTCGYINSSRFGISRFCLAANILFDSIERRKRRETMKSVLCNAHLHNLTGYDSMKGDAKVSDSSFGGGVHSFSLHFPSLTPEGICS